MADPSWPHLTLLTRQGCCLCEGLQERLEALLVAAYDEIKADLSGDAARRERLEAHCERLELESRMAWQSLRRIAGVCRAAARTPD